VLNPNDLLIITPHPGLEIPPDIDGHNINPDIADDLFIPVDKDTDQLYKIPGIQQFIFPYLRSLIDVNQVPDDLDNSCPDKTIYDDNIFLNDYTLKQRKYFIEKYHNAFHDDIIDYLGRHHPRLIIDGHSTHDNDVDDYGDRFSGDITISNLQITDQDSNWMTKTCSNELIEYFAGCLDEHGILCKVNTDYLVNTYGYIEELYSKRFGIPLILIECNQRLYDGNIANVNAILYKSIDKTLEWMREQ